MDKFILKQQGLHWDGVPIPKVNIAEFDLSLFRKRASRSQRLPEETLNEEDALLIEKLRLVDGPYFKRAAVLLFHRDPEKYITGAYIKIAFFESNSELLYQDEIHGNLFEQVEKTLDLLLTKYLKAMISYDGIQRLETYPYPKEALREALLNAVAHKDYSSGVPIQISVYEEKLMIWNNGQLHSGWTVDNLLNKHSSQPFNPDIANAFFRVGMIEPWGRGIEKMCAACEDHGVPAPELDYEEGGLWVNFTLGKVKASSGKTSGKTSGKIMTEIKNNQLITIPELAEICSVTERSIERNISSLQRLNLLKRIGPAKGGYWDNAIKFLHPNFTQSP